MQPAGYAGLSSHVYRAMRRHYETPNYGLSNEPQTSQASVIRQLEAAERSLDPLPQGTVDEESETRLALFLDEDDHQKCVEGNKAALLAEKLERLRSLKYDIAKEDWMFDQSRSSTSFSISGWKLGS
ncbi:hypothetical protein ACHAW6_001070 [Cyclotella cf. meneghiniana]